MKAPKLYKKKDGAYYFTFKGRQHYAGRTLEKAEAKLREVTALEPEGETCLVTLVGRYLDSLQSPKGPAPTRGQARLPSVVCAAQKRPSAKSSIF